MEYKNYQRRSGLSLDDKVNTESFKNGNSCSMISISRSKKKKKAKRHVSEFYQGKLLLFLNGKTYRREALNAEPGEKWRYIQLISLQPKVCYFSARPVPPLAGLSFQKQGLSYERHKRWTGREGGGGGG